MKHTITLKFIAILLAACALVAAAGSAVGIALMGEAELYAMDFEQWLYSEQETRARSLAGVVNERYTVRQLGDFPDSVLNMIGGNESDEIYSSWYGVSPDSWSYVIIDEAGTELERSGLNFAGDAFTFQVNARYPVLTTEDGDYDLAYQDEETGYTFYVRYENGPTNTVTVTTTEGFIEEYGGIPTETVRLLFGLRYSSIAILAVSLLLFAICAVYLCCAAGKTAKDAPVCPGGLNRLPLDLYAVVAGAACVLLVVLAVAILANWFYDGDYFNIGAAVLAAMVLLVAAVIGIGFLFAVAAQFKMHNFFWWKNSAIGWCLGMIWRGLRFMFRGLCKLFGLMPLIWKYILIGLAMGFFPLFFCYLAAVGRDYWVLPLLFSLACDLVIICYGAYAFGTLLKGARRMTQGNLHTKIPTGFLFGSFKICAEHLNALADVATVAVKKQMKSERMKTELITNVSHDIKTPLTSIINYVDLLQKPHSEQEGAQYLEVLGRQSQRLKKLIEDLMDMSKATTGNMAVDITQVDAAEAVNQALGEFADKLLAADLQPVFRQPEGTVAMQADGRLTWRVLSNLLSNIVKYALPGTRVYIDLMKLEGQVLISLKNISREELNVSADELTERFVRGDVSRNTEGSGLGLNIAKSLMELQKGQLQLLVDGDLFKVTLVFPAG